MQNVGFTSGNKPRRTDTARATVQFVVSVPAEIVSMQDRWY